VVQIGEKCCNFVNNEGVKLVYPQKLWEKFEKFQLLANRDTCQNLILLLRLCDLSKAYELQVLLLKTKSAIPQSGCQRHRASAISWMPEWMSVSSLKVRINLFGKLIKTNKIRYSFSSYVQAEK
jgi:hypothetical protein